MRAGAERAEVTIEQVVRVGVVSAWCGPSMTDWKACVLPELLATARPVAY
jgi:hypothetical protein